MKRTPLKRYTPLRRDRPKNRYRDADERDLYYRNRRRRWEIAQGECEARWHPSCPTLIWDYTERQAATIDHRGWQAHHIERRTDGGSHDIDNLLWVCEWCHNRIHARPAEARNRGLLR